MPPSLVSRRVTARMLVPLNQYSSPFLMPSQIALSAAKSAAKSPVRVRVSWCAASTPSSASSSGVTLAGGLPAG